MTPEKLHKIILQFTRKSSQPDIYRLGKCSEVAISLQKFVKGGEIYKHTLWHTILFWKGNYFDSLGKHDLLSLKTTNPIGASESPHKATKEELAHINDLLEHDTVENILIGLKQAEKEIEK